MPCLLAKIVINIDSEHDLIEAPEPDDGTKQAEDEEDPIDLEIRLYGVVLNQNNICKNMANNTFIPYVSKCSSYIECADGIAYPGSCYSDYNIDYFCDGKLEGCDLGFDYSYQVCNLKENGIKCMPKCDRYNLTSFCYDRTCTKYVLCYYGLPVLRECQDGLQYNAETDRCDFPQYVDCVDNECAQEMTPWNITYLASKARCDKYYVCSDGKAFPQECSKGLYFNQKDNKCDFQSSVDCKITAEQRNIKSFSRAPPRRADIVCPKTGVHFYAHKTRREAYYYCVNGNGVILDCTPGLFFDPLTRECREPKYIGS